MALAIGTRTTSWQQCDSCGRTYEFVQGFVWKDDEPWAVYFGACHGHPEHEAWLDVTLGTWGEDVTADHVTFSCRVRQDGAAAVNSPAALQGVASMFGETLTRERALAHERVGDFWDVVDAVLLHDPSVRAHVYA